MNSYRMLVKFDNIIDAMNGENNLENIKSKRSKQTVMVKNPGTNSYVTTFFQNVCFDKPWLQIIN